MSDEQETLIAKTARAFYGAQAKAKKLLSQRDLSLDVDIDPLTFACPYCGSAAGKECIIRAGEPTPPHKKRKHVYSNLELRIQNDPTVEAARLAFVRAEQGLR